MKNSIARAFPVHPSFVRLGSIQRRKILEHLLAQSDDDRTMRFGSVESGAGIAAYVQSINFNRDLVVGLEMDGQVVALAHVAVFQEDGYPVGEVGITVSPEARGAGYGIGIMQHCFALAAAKRVTRMHVQFLRRNHRMARICNRLQAPIEFEGDEASSIIPLYHRDEFHYCEHAFIGANPRIEVFYREPAAPIDTILMVHGAGGCGWQFRDNFLAYFASQGYRAISLSLRHHGRSTASNELQMHDYERDIDSVIAHFGVPGVLVGHSMGGLVVQRYMEKHDIAHGVLLASVPPWGLADQSFMETFKAGLHCEQSAEIVERARSGRLVIASPDRVSGNIHVIGGLHDQAVPLPWLRRTAEAYQGIPTIVSAGHNLMQGPNWLLAANAVIDTIRQTSRRGKGFNPLTPVKEEIRPPIPVEVSARHVHLSQDDVENLFGPGYQLTPENELSQPGQFMSAERVNLLGPKGQISNVRVIGPTRKETQVEIAMTDKFKLGIQPPIRESGDLANTPGIVIEGPHGVARIQRGVICVQRHIHMSPEDAMRFGLRDKYVVRVRIEGERELTFGDVLVRVAPGYRLAMHIDTDEGNAAGIGTERGGFIEEIQSRA